MTVSPDTAALASINENIQLTGTALDGSGDAISGKTFAWTSSDEAVARVDAAGLVSARANGSATITATVDGVSSTSTITVQQVPAALTFTIGLVIAAFLEAPA